MVYLNKDLKTYLRNLFKFLTKVNAMQLLFLGGVSITSGWGRTEVLLRRAGW